MAQARCERDLPGSSPRLRGTWTAARGRACCLRFIPAPAGNIRPRAPSHRPIAVHPRACGEHVLPRLDQCRNLGSSPRLRGTSSSGLAGRTVGRFIPAPAGNIKGESTDHAKKSVHPRACGEHVQDVIERLDPDGSSPRLRGTSALIEAQKELPRFIPAPAGNIATFGRVSKLPPVHPRACGEHLRSISSSFSRTGSSPRLRGTSSQYQAQMVGPRFIPAPAGNIGRHRPSHLHKPVHPRACGEHTFRYSVTIPGYGSSPRLRGTYIILTDCYSVGYMLLKIGTNDLAPDSSPTSAKHIHIIQAKRIRDGDHQNPQVSGDLCQRSQT